MKSLKRSIPFALVLLAVALVGCGYNDIQRSDEAVKAAWAEVENQFQRRMDLIPNLVNTVKGAASFEQETLTAVIEARSQAAGLKMDASVLEDPAAFQRLQQVQSQLGSALQRLMVVVERYPELQAVGRFQELQAQIEGTENRIAVARRRFIEQVASYNTLVRVFPSNLTARVIGAAPKPTFEATSGAESVPEVQF
jgi:LemA protein